MERTGRTSLGDDEKRAASAVNGINRRRRRRRRRRRQTGQGVRSPPCIVYEAERPARHYTSSRRQSQRNRARDFSFVSLHLAQVDTELMLPFDTIRYEMLFYIQLYFTIVCCSTT